MPIPISCSCGARMSAPDTAAGKRVKCPKCGAALAVPAPAASFEVVDEDEATPPPPKRPPVKVARPASDVKRKVTGNWKLDVVIDQTGAVRDVRIAERPKMEPEWPEFEAQVLSTVKGARIGPATVDGQPWPHCMTVTVKD